MKNTIWIICVILAFLGCQKHSKFTANVRCVETQERLKDCEEIVIQNDSTSFPKTSDTPDYKVRNYQAKVAFPIHADSARVWVKGSKQFSHVQVYGKNVKSKSVKLQAPFYTKIISLSGNPTEVQVKFSADKQNLAESNYKQTVFPKSLASIKQKEKQFSLLFYGCFQPFMVGKEGNSEVIHKKKQLNYASRKTFGMVSEQAKFSYTRVEPKGEEIRIPNQILLPNPKLIIGTGDQIYTDAGYKEKKMENHPLSAWAHICNNPYSLLDTTAYVSHLNKCYQYFNSFQCFEQAQSRLPSLNVWDDHEIRDGWGSHGDEYSNGEMSAGLKPYFESSRASFLKHQWQLGPNPTETDSIGNSLEQITKVGGIQVFAFDLRTKRSSCDSIVIGKLQMKRFQNWCAQLGNGKEALIVSSMPFFYEPSKTTRQLTRIIANGELRDDVIDGWASNQNIKERDLIITELIKLREREVKPIIVSGDVHVGGMMTVWYESENAESRKKLCYELIFSGLSHESLGQARSSFESGLKTKTERAQVHKFTSREQEYKIYPVYEIVESQLNFGGLEFNKDKKTIASLFLANKKTVREQELTLNWEESFDAYKDRAKKPLLLRLIPFKSTSFKPPKLPYNSISISKLIEP